jgi:hypothetical protein
MSPEEHIHTLADERQEIMNSLHQIVLNRDKSISPVVELMMGKLMIVYKERGYMKYGLASGKKYMSFHCMPIYGSHELHDKYMNLLPGANFQKGCINFNSIVEMPLEVADNLLQDCASISIATLIENRKRIPGSSLINRVK